MNTGAHDAGGGFTQSVGTNAARGVSVILAAVAVGALLMWLGYSNDSVDATADGDGSALVSDDDGSGDDGSTDGTSDDSAESTSTTEATTTTTTAPPVTARPAAEVSVVVMNATEGKPGIAGRTSAIVEQAGYTMLEASNANVDQDTAIQYAPDYEADAVAVAEVFGLDGSVVEPFPDELNIRDQADVAGANVIVFVGLDGRIDP
ncbi:MAG: LytR C-terminal domain-containing protein [Acidimicrobiia bacterium]|nr:LytR C-terminal domain-containing protein [Acidimicrobiia bacterium]